MNNKQQPPLPTLQPGDSHMESLIEAAIQGHADTRDAMRWLVRQLVPATATQPAEVTDEQISACVKRASTYGLPFVGLLNPGGTPSDFSKRFTAEILALRPVQVPMTPLTDAQMEKGRDQIFSINNPYCPCDHKTFKKVAQWVERHHQIGITAQAKKEQA